MRRLGPRTKVEGGARSPETTAQAELTMRAGELTAPSWQLPPLASAPFTAARPLLVPGPNLKKRLGCSPPLNHEKRAEACRPWQRLDNSLGCPCVRSLELCIDSKAAVGIAGSG